jgi:immunity protein, SdpI family
MRKWYPVALIVLAFAVSAAAFGRLPDRIATHFDGSGNANGWSNRFFGAFLLPTILLLVWPIMRFLPRIDPRRANYEKFQGTYDALIYSVMTMMFVIHLMILGGALGLPIRIERLMPVLVGTLLVIVGNLLPRARSNFFFGIRTPWTLSSDRVWDRTHRLGGYLLMGAGVVVVASAMLKPVTGSIVMGSAVGAAALISVVYSYLVWRKEPPTQGTSNNASGQSVPR